MRPCDVVGCEFFPCADVRHSRFSVPDVEVDPPAVRVVLISEAAPLEPEDGYYAAGNPLFARTTVQAFRDAGAEVSTVADIVALGVYLTTAVKCAKTGYGIATSTIKECSRLLERELDLFPNVRAYLLMGDVAIASVNAIAARAGDRRPIPAGSTYKIRGGDYRFRGARALPSYVQAGPSFFIEKSKRAMIAQDIAAALEIAREG
jgi:uracil-DNA glycosylase